MQTLFVLVTRAGTREEDKELLGTEDSRPGVTGTKFLQKRGKHVVPTICTAYRIE